MKNNRYIIFFIFILSLNDLAFSSRPEVLDSFYTVRQGKVLTVDLQIAAYEIFFDQPLYVTFVDWCPPIECPPDDSECEPCDYSKKGLQCGTSKPKPGFESSNVTCTCPEIEKYCDPYLDWVTLNDGDITDPIPNDVTKQPFYRFYFNEPCRAFSIHMTAWNDDMNLMLSNFNPTPDLKNAQSETFEAVTICPSTWHYKLGTWFIGVNSRTYTHYSLSLRFFDVEKKPYQLIQPKSCPGGTFFTTYCPEVGVNYGPIEQSIIPIIWNYQLTKCSQYMLFVDILSPSSLNAPITNSSSSGYVASSVSTETLKPVYQPSDLKGIILAQQPGVVDLCKNNWTDPYSVDDPETVSNYSSYFQSLSADHLVTISVILIKISDIDDSKVWRVPLTDQPYGWTAWKYILATLLLECPNLNAEYYCYPSSYHYPPGCRHFFPVLPSDDPDLLSPRPVFLRQQDFDIFSGLSFLKDTKITANKLSAGSIIYAYKSGVINQEFNDKDLESCYLQLTPTSRVSNKDGLSWRPQSLYPKKKEMECDPDKFEEISQNMDSLADEINNILQTVGFQPRDVLALRYQVDSLTFSNTWQGCQNYIESFLESKYENVVLSDTTECTLAMLRSGNNQVEDICCNPELQWDTCCTDRTVSSLELISTIDKNTFDRCSESECLEPLLEDYMYFSSLTGSVDGCSSAIQGSQSVLRQTTLDFYRVCKEEFYGVDGDGKFCSSNDDCLYDCDTIKHRCTYTHEQSRNLDYKFLKCLSENMSPSVELLFSRLHSWNFTTSDELTDLLYNTYVTENCLSSYGLSHDYSTHWERNRYVRQCSPCFDYWCSDRSCTVPLSCEDQRIFGRPGSFCVFIWAISGTYPTNCESEKYCTYDYSLNETECLNGMINSSYFCGACGSDSHCIEVTSIDSSKECEDKGTICVLPDGTLLPDATKSECQKMGMCSIPCFESDGTPCSQDSCEKFGSCSSDDVIDFSIQTFKYLSLGTTPYNGTCLKKMNPWNNVDCADTNSKLENYPFSDQCVSVNTKQSLCKSPSFWLDTIDNEEECLSHKSCFEQSKVPTQLQSIKDEEECISCDGEYKSVYSWTKGQWLKGKMMPTVWEERKWENEFKWEETLDLGQLVEDISNTYSLDYSYQIQTELQCRYGSLKRVMSQILCTCIDGKSNDQCFTEDTYIVGLGEACPKIESEIVAPPSRITFSSESIINECINVHIKLILSSDIKNPPKLKLTNSFNKKKTGSDNVRNDKSAFVGELIGNGVLLEFKGKSEGLQFLELCLQYDSNELNSEYPIFDFGFRIQEDEVRPLGLKITKSSFGICSNLTLQEILNFPTLFPIIRYDGWQDEDDSLSTKDQAIFYVMFSLYLVLGIFIFSKEIQMIHFDLKKPLRWIMWLLMVLTLFRLIYFALLATSTLNSNTDLAELVIVEIPTFCLFLALNIEAGVWIGVIKSSSLQAKKIRNIFLYVSFGSIFLFTALFFISVGIFSTFDDEGKYTCGDRIYQEPDYNSQTTLKWFYRVLVVVITLGVIIPLGISGYKLATDKTVASISKKSGSHNLQQRITLLTGISTICLFSECLFFSLIAGLEISEPALSFVLLFIEIIPISIMAHLIFISLRQQVKKGSKGSQMSSTALSSRATSRSDGV